MCVECLNIKHILSGDEMQFSSFFFSNIAFPAHTWRKRIGVSVSDDSLKRFDGVNSTVYPSFFTYNYVNLLIFVFPVLGVF